MTTCSYPDFRFDSEGTGGEGGESSSSSGVVPQVSCGAPATQCTPGQVCCFHKMVAAMDHCGDATTCGPDYDEFYCNTTADCPGGICCAKDNNVAAMDGIDVISCQTTCAADIEFVMCEQNAECPSGMCVSILETPYPGYNFCVK